MYDFAYACPTSLNEAAELARDGDAKVLAGGMTLIPTCKQRLTKPSMMIDLRALPQLVGIEASANTITIGAMTTHAEVASSPDIRRALPALAYLAESIGDAQVRNRGTIGGSLANNDPAADYPAGALGLGATVHTTKRSLLADDYFQGLFETALEPGEIIASITFPLPLRAGYAKYRNPASRYAIIGVMASQSLRGIRVAVTGAGTGVFRLPAVEEALAQNWSEDAIKAVSVPLDLCSGDMHASSEYRAHLVGVMVRRAVAAARHAAPD